MYKKRQHIHFVGIGGIGMSGIAELLCNLGYRVSGSDLHDSDTVHRLARLGCTVHQGHQGQWIGDADVVVVSSAIRADNPEVQAARAHHVPVIQRAEMLAELMRLKRYGIAVAGSHGKTTTSSMVGWMLQQAGLDPTLVIGGKVDSLGGNAKLGQGEFLVAEADESDGSFLKLAPVIEVVTNIDAEHLDYYRDIEEIKDVFVRFIDKIPFYGAAILCLDDDNVAEILPRLGKRLITYGLSEQANLTAAELRPEGRGSRFVVRREGELLGEMTLAVPGRHNVLNSLAAVAVGLELEIDFAVIAASLATFSGVQRRLQRKGQVGDILVLDDYGHHPTEIRATLEAVRQAWPDRRLVVLFQPHRYTRTRALFDHFKTAFHRADVLVLTEIYPASEEPIPGIDGASLAEAVRRHGQREVHFLPDLAALASGVPPLLRDGDLVLTLGAGNIVRAGEELLLRLASGATGTALEVRG
ncbi:MAG: UDP-N-acetylmuramate--L-alanine ligase [Desulfobulbaceae bacterium A2]|nr:MAG: UDP-N-acetylmuramate--L-alanine ligase [Desulfobulbaceae bacterium A2]